MRGIKKVIFAVLFGVGVSGIIYTISQTTGYRYFLRLQNSIDDSHFIHWKKKELAEDEIVVIDIDDASLSALGNFKRWPRRHFGTVINRANEDGARMVFLDVILLQGGLRQDNDRLTDSVKDAGNVILGYYFRLDSKSRNKRPLDPVYNEKFAMNWFNTQRIEKNEFILAGAVNLPFPELVRSAAGMGFTNYIPDPDGVLRHIPLYIAYNHSLFPSAALQMWLHLRGLTQAKAEISPRGARIDGCFIPTDKHSFIRLNFRSSGLTHTTLSFADVLRGRFPRGSFQNKIVMIGSSSSELGDLKIVPGHNALPGVEIHAAALSTLLSEKHLTLVSGNTVFLLTLLCGVIVSLLFAFYSPFLVGVPAALAAPLALYIYSVYCFVFHSELLNISIPSVSVLFIGVVLIIHHFIERHAAQEKSEPGEDENNPADGIQQ